MKMVHGSLRRTLAWGSLVAVILSIAFAMVYHKELTRVYHVIRLFEPEDILHNFRSMETMFDTAPVRRGPVAHQFERNVGNLPSRGCSWTPPVGCSIIASEMSTVPWDVQ